MNKFQNFGEEFGYTNDTNKEVFDHIFSQNILQSVKIDVYMEKPYLLFLRRKEKNVKVQREDNRIVLYTKSRSENTVLNILVDMVENCTYRKFDDSTYCLYFTVLSNTYRIFVEM